MKLYILSCFLALILYGCIEPFQPEVGDADSALVVDGVFSNSNEPSVVILSLSLPYSTSNVVFVEGATVIIEDEGGTRTQLQEHRPGHYQTDPTVLKGEIGKGYRLLVETPDGNQFESEWELMKAAPPIGAIDVVFEERIPNDSDKDPIPTALFFLDTEDLENKTRFYRWEFVETYQYLLIHDPQIRAEFGDPPASGNDQIFFIDRTELNGYKCWKTENSTSILVASTKNLSTDAIVDFPLHTIDNTTPRLSNRYSLLTKQYAISETYYRYLKTLEEVNETTGSLFDPTPNEFFGNVKSSTDKDIPVLGFFSVAGVSKKRIFVNRDALPNGFLMPSGPSCFDVAIDLDFFELWGRTRNNTLVLYNYRYPPPPAPPIPIGYLLTEPPCAYCTANAATNMRPDFW